MFPAVTYHLIGLRPNLGLYLRYPPVALRRLTAMIIMRRASHRLHMCALLYLSLLYILVSIYPMGQLCCDHVPVKILPISVVPTSTRFRQCLTLAWRVQGTLPG